MSEYEKIYLKLDRDWYYIAEGKKSTEEINKDIAENRELKRNAENKSFPILTLPENEKIKIKAKQNTELEFSKNYGVFYEKQ